MPDQSCVIIINNQVIDYDYDYTLTFMCNRKRSQMFAYVPGNVPECS